MMEDKCLCLWAGWGHVSKGAYEAVQHEAVHTGIYPAACPKCRKGHGSACTRLSEPSPPNPV